MEFKNLFFKNRSFQRDIKPPVKAAQIYSRPIGPIQHSPEMRLSPSSRMKYNKEVKPLLKVAGAEFKINQTYQLPSEYIGERKIIAKQNPFSNLFKKYRK